MAISYLSGNRIQGEAGAKTPAEVGAMLDAYLLGEEGTNEGTDTTTPPPSTDTVSSVDAAFNELMGA